MSLLRLHESRVSKTRFITFINIRDEPRTTTTITTTTTKTRYKKREELRTSKKNPSRTRPRPGSARPRSRCDPGPITTQVASLIWAKSLDSFSLWSDCCVSVFLKFFFFFVYFGLYERVETLNFFKIFLVYKLRGQLQ